jgi:hypothetical protein
MKTSDPVQPLRQPFPGQPAPLIIDDLHIVMVFSPVLTDEQHSTTSPRVPSDKTSSAEQTSRVLMGKCSPTATRGTTSQQQSHPLTTSGRTVCCKTSPKIRAGEC